jgi:hypothetical protein
MAEEQNTTTAVALPAPPTDLASLIGNAEERGSATGADIREQMAGEPRLEQVKVVHAGGMFELPGGDSVKEFSAIVLAATLRNAKFLKPADEVGEDEENRPECFSVDGVVPSAASPDRKCATCTGCHFNRAAKDPEARNAAWEKPRKETCGNFLSLAVLLPGSTVPYHLRFSSSAFKAWDTFVQRIGTRGSWLPHEVVAKFTLEKKKNGPNTYSVPVIELVGPIAKEHRAAFAQMREEYLALLRREPLTRGGGDGDGYAGDAREAQAAAKAAAQRAGAAGGKAAL